MQPKPGHILCLIGILMLLCNSVRAQEAYPLEGAGSERSGSYTPVDGETGSHLRVTETGSGEYADADTSTYVTTAPGGRAEESQSTRAAEKEISEQSGDQESVLGFNFLYYIIQKFKMSDIVEK